MTNNGYFKLGNDFKNLIREKDVKDRLSSGGKLFAKTTFNVAKYTIKELPKAIERAAENNKK